MNTLKNIRRDIKGYVLVYTLLFISFVLYVVFSALENIPAPKNSDIPAYSLDKINQVNKSLSQREKLEPLPETELPQIEFGKEEPFR